MTATKSPNVFDLMSLKGKVAVVTGGARGLGYEMMLALAEAGADVACIDILSDMAVNSAEIVAADCKVKASGWGCDVADEDQVASVFQKIVEHHGQIDVLVTAAGINKNGKAFEFTGKDVRKIFDINVTGTFFCMQQAAKHMIDAGRGGSIVTVASMSAHIFNTPQFHAPYNATKAAVLQLSRCLACEWGPHNIRVTTISPGYFATEMTNKLIADCGTGGENMVKTWKAKSPLGRVGTPHELKGTVVFLASEASSFCTGTEILVHGGATAW
ncbi:hypothetical protein BDB00DRAFT_869349 [Zychaea mexicana]|uniref:uncharacterized protein n=1 Tax=Zychaea mexicana TaxID=64656 RepID=UPI0022FF3898|nr:uncharacterized protein BDB00DRAFT_869349 [Zychaea mexicana]KAI9496410.1 hypothetical protein BDB00DRAFT_869349 [Zychaea mexicana]